MPDPNSKLRIAVLGTRGFPEVQGGVEKHCEELYPRLANGNCEVTVFTRKPYVNLNIHTYKGVRLVPLSCPKSKFFEAFIHTFIGVIIIRGFSPDILHIHAIGPSLFIPLARLLGLKVVMTHHGPDYKRKKWGKLAKTVLKLGERLGCKWSNCIITISGTIAEHVRRKYKKDTIIIPNGVTIPGILQNSNSLKKYGLTKGKYILSVGRFVPEKGFHDLIDSFNRFSTCNFKPQYLNNQSTAQDWKLVIAGDSDHEDKYSLELKKMAYNTKNVIMTGFLTGGPLHELYGNAGLFVLPSYYEGLPIVLLEAMSYGLSCIASDIPANRDVELLEEDRFFKVGDVGALAKKLGIFSQRTFTDEEKRSQLNRIEEKYNWDKITDRTLEVYKEVLVD